MCRNQLTNYSALQPRIPYRIYPANFITTCPRFLNKHTHKGIPHINKNSQLILATIDIAAWQPTTNPGDFSHSGLATPNISEIVCPIPRLRKLAMNPLHNLWHSVSKFRLQIPHDNNKRCCIKSWQIIDQQQLSCCLHISGKTSKQVAWRHCIQQLLIRNKKQCITEFHALVSQLNGW